MSDKTPVFTSHSSEFPYHIRPFQLANDYDACVELFRMSMNSIAISVPGVAPDASHHIEEEIEKSLLSDMQPGDAGIPAHYMHPARSGFWVAVATEPREPHHRLPGLQYPEVVGMVALLPCEIASPEYVEYCRTQGIDITGEAELKRMVCAASTRRQGVGTALLKVVFDFARTQHYAAIRLMTVWNNDGAIALYKREGFNLTRTIMFDISGAPAIDASASSQPAHSGNTAPKHQFGVCDFRRLLE